MKGTLFPNCRKLKENKLLLFLREYNLKNKITTL